MTAARTRPWRSRGSFNSPFSSTRRNFGYGANQKTCYTEALKEGADIIVMLHPDYQYDPALLPEILAPIKAGEADIVLGSRFLSGSTMQQGMPWWKFLGNKFLTALENWTLGLNLSEYHTGYRAYSRRVLEEIPYSLNSDKFVFDQEILVQARHLDFVIKEVPVPTKYFPEASNASFVDSARYGLSILFLLGRYFMHRGVPRRTAPVSILSHSIPASAVSGPHMLDSR